MCQKESVTRTMEEGMYIDTNLCLQLIVATSYDKHGRATSWEIHGMEYMKTDDIPTPCYSTAALKCGDVQVTIMDTTLHLATQEGGALKWGDDTVWYPVKCTYPQIHQIRKGRRAMPMTSTILYLSLLLFKNMIVGMCNCLPISFFCNVVEVPDSSF